MSQKGEASKKRNEFITRTLSGAVLLAVVLGCLMFGKATFLLLLLIIGLGSQVEFLGISRQAVCQKIQTIGYKRMLKSFEFDFKRIENKLLKILPAQNKTLNLQ